MISTVKREIAIEKELRSKIEWENALVKYTKIILPLKYIFSIFWGYFLLFLPILVVRVKK